MIKGAIAGVFKQASGIPTRAAWQGALTKIGDNMKALSAKGVGKDMLETIVITIVKNIPKMVVNHQIRTLLESDMQAVAGAQALNDSQKRVAVLEAAVADIEFARLTMEGLATDITSFFGSSADASAVVQCSVDLESDLASADDQYQLDIAPAEAVIELLQDDLKADDLTFFASCHNGDLRRQLDRAGARLKVAAHRAASSTATGSIATRLQTVADAQVNYEDGLRAYEVACTGRLDDLGVVSRSTAESYLTALTEIALAQGGLADARDFAWEDYDACHPGNPFLFTQDLVSEAVPWDGDSRMADRFPSVCSLGALYFTRGLTTVDTISLGVPTSVVTGQIAVDAVAVGGGKLYWAPDDRILRANLDGSEEEVLNTNAGYVRGLSLDVEAGKIYWTSGRTVRRSNLDGSSEETIVTFPDGVDLRQVAADTLNARIYMTVVGDGIYRTNYDGSGFSRIVVSAVANSGIAVDSLGGKVYWSNYSIGDEDTVTRANLDGTGVQIVLGNIDFTLFWTLALDPGGGSIYISNHEHIKRSNLNGSGYGDYMVSPVSGSVRALAFGK